MTFENECCYISAVKMEHLHFYFDESSVEACVSEKVLTVLNALTLPDPDSAALIYSCLLGSSTHY